MTAVLRAGAICLRRRTPRWALFVAPTLPALAFLAGARAGETFRPLVESSRPAALSAAVGLGGTAVVAGLVVALVAPGRTFLGSQLAGAPLSSLRLFALVTLAPVLALGAAATTVEAAFLVPALGASAPVALAAGWAGFALGAAAAEGALARRLLTRAAVLAGVVGLWALGTAGAGAGGLAGPFGQLGRALRGEQRAGAATLALGSLALAALGLWALAAASRGGDEPMRRQRRALLRICGGPLPAAFTAALKRYGRRRELRRTGGAAAGAAAVAGLLLAIRAGPGAVPLAGLLAVLGAAVVPLAAGGLDRESVWLWRAAPVRRGASALAAATASVVAALALVALGAGPAAVWTRPPGHALLQVLGLAALVVAAALLAGALVPWRPDHAGDELASLATLVVAAAGLWYALGGAAEALGGGAAVSAGLLGGALAAALGVSAGVAAARAAS